MKEEIIKLYVEYCDYVEDNCEKKFIGITNVSFIQRDFFQFMNWLENGEKTDFNK